MNLSPGVPECAPDAMSVLTPAEILGEIEEAILRNLIKQPGHRSESVRVLRSAFKLYDL